ncbi:hypothetical protein [Natrinema halophilum]|nr:hypothetical protein [Natrinema halophilum]
MGQERYRASAESERSIPELGVVQSDREAVGEHWRRERETC